MKQLSTNLGAPSGIPQPPLIFQKTRIGSDLVNLTTSDTAAALVLGQSLVPDSRFKPVAALSADPNVFTEVV